MRAHPFVPYFYSERDGEKASTQLKPIALATEAQALAASGIICSSLFYVWWLTSSDCYHLNKREVDGLPVNIANSHLVGSLAASSKELMTDLKAKSRRRVYVYKTSGRVEYDEFYPKLSKPIIDKIDQVLAQYYGFTNEELDFIINYDIKYRMGRDAEDEGDEGQPGADEADPAPPARSTERNGDKGPAVKAAAPAAAPAGTTPRAEDFGGAGPTQMPLEPGAQQLGLDAAATGPAWRVGARVRHAAFGEGQVVAVERAGAAQTVTVQFAGKRRKQFLARQAPLERV
jgi:hypothetical protein